MAVALKEVLLVQEVLVLDMEGVAVALGQEKVALVQEKVAVAQAQEVLVQELAVAVDQEEDLDHMEGIARLAS